MASFEVVEVRRAGSSFRLGQVPIQSRSSATAPKQIFGEHAKCSRTPTIRRDDKVRVSAAWHSKVEPQASLIWTPWTDYHLKRSRDGGCRHRRCGRNGVVGFGVRQVEEASGSGNWWALSWNIADRGRAIAAQHRYGS